MNGKEPEEKKREFVGGDGEKVTQERRDIKSNLHRRPLKEQTNDKKVQLTGR
jgi:hypothetical protein